MGKCALHTCVQMDRETEAKNAFQLMLEWDMNGLINRQVQRTWDDWT